MNAARFISAGALDIVTVAVFLPFDEINGSRIDVDPEGPNRWDLTGYMRGIDGPARRVLKAEGADRSALLQLPHVPEWARAWKGQYEIEIHKVEATEDCSDVVLVPKPEVEPTKEAAEAEIRRLRGMNIFAEPYGRNIRQELEDGYKAGIVPVEEVDRVAQRLEELDRIVARALPTGPFGMDGSDLEDLIFIDSGQPQIGRLFSMDHCGFANDHTGATARMYGRYIVAALNAVRGTPLDVLLKLDGAVVEMDEVRELIKQGQSA